MLAQADTRVSAQRAQVCFDTIGNAPLPSVFRRNGRWLLAIGDFRIDGTDLYPLRYFVCHAAVTEEIRSNSKFLRSRKGVHDITFARAK